MHFLKGVAKWATIWTVVIVALMLYSVASDGKRVTFGDAILFSVVCWPVMAGFVTFVRLKMVVQTYGEAAGRRLVRGATESDEDVKQRALIAGGFKPAPARPDPPPALPRS